MKAAAFEYHLPACCRGGGGGCWRSSVTRPRCSPAARAWCRCWRCGWPASSTSSTSAASRSSPASPGRTARCGWAALTRHRVVERDPVIGGRGAAAGPGHPVHRALPDPQPRHARRLARPRRPGRGATRGRGGARRRDRGAQRPGRRRIPAADFFIRVLDDDAGARRAADRGAVPGVGRPAGVRGRRVRPAARRLRPGRRRCARCRWATTTGSSGAADRPARTWAATPVRAGRRRAGPGRRRRRRRLDGSTRSAATGGGRRSSRRRTSTARRLPPRASGAADRASAGQALARGDRDGRRPMPEIDGAAQRQRRARRGARRAAEDAGRLPARGLRLDRHAPRLRARRVRCLHGAGGR